MNKEAITVGDVYISTGNENHYMKTEVVRATIKYLRQYYHKVGHIEKFAEALKELQEMAENI